MRLGQGLRGRRNEKKMGTEKGERTREGEEDTKQKVGIGKET